MAEKGTINRAATGDDRSLDGHADGRGNKMEEIKIESDEEFEYVRVPKARVRQVLLDAGQGKDNDHLKKRNTSRNVSPTASPDTKKRLNPKRSKVSLLRVGDDELVMPQSQRGNRWALPKPKAMEAKVPEQALESTPGGINYRSNLQSVLKEIWDLKFTDQQIAAIDKTPFSIFFRSVREMDNKAVSVQFKKYNQNITRLVKRFRQVGDDAGFVFGETFIAPAKIDVQLIFGIRDGVRNIDVSGWNLDTTGFLMRCFPERAKSGTADNPYRLTPALLIKVLTELVKKGDRSPAEDVERVLHLYLLAVIFAPRQSWSISWKLTELMDDFDCIGDYDWSSYILDELMDDLSSSKKYRIGSCAIFLLFWLCEHAAIIRPEKRHQHFPRYLKWDLNKLADRFSTLDLDVLDSITDIKSRIYPTEYEIMQLEPPTDDEVDGFRPVDIDDSTPLVRDPRKGKGVAVVHDESGDEDADGGEEIYCSALPRNNTQPQFRLGGESVIESTSPIERKLMDSGLPDFESAFEGFQIGAVVNGDSCASSPQQTKGSEDGGMKVDTGGASIKIKSPGRDQLTVKFRSTGDAPGKRQLFSLNESAMKYQNDKRLKELQMQIEERDNIIVKLKCDLEVKDSTKSAEESEAIAAYRETSRDMLDCARADLAEALEVKKNVVSQLQAAKRQFMAAAFDRDVLQKKLSEGINRCLELERVNSELTTMDRDNKSRKIALIIENDSMKEEIADLHRQLDSLQLQVGKPNVSAGSTPVSTSCAPEKVTPQSLIPLNQFGLGSGSSMNSTDPSSSKGILRVQSTTGYTSSNSAAKEFGDMSGKKLFSMPVSESQEKVPRSLSFDMSAQNLPVEVKIEPVEYEHDVVGHGYIDPSADVVILTSNYPKSEKSMYTKIQERTQLDQRKKTNLGTPVPLVYSRYGKKPKGDEIRQMVVDRERFAYHRLSIPVLSWLVIKFRTKLPCETLLHVQNSYMNNYITLEDIETILNHQSLDDGIIDTWGLLTNQIANSMMPPDDSRTAIARQTYLFRSFLWLNVARYDMDTQCKGMTHTFLDKKIHDALKYDTRLFPINTIGMADYRKHVGNHWTLLSFTVSNCEWKFYNPMKSQVPNMDQHYKQAMVLVKHVEKQIRLHAGGMRLPISRSDYQTSIIYHKETPQQYAGTLDCGVVVCSMMESLINKKQIIDARWTEEIGGIRRAAMVDVFCQTVMRNGPPTK